MDATVDDIQTFFLQLVDVPFRYSLRPPQLEELKISVRSYAEHWGDLSGLRSMCKEALERFCSDGVGLKPSSVIPTLVISPILLEPDLSWYQERVGNLVLQAW